MRGQQRQMPGDRERAREGAGGFALLVDCDPRAAAREQGSALGLHGQGDHEAQEAVLQRDLLRLPHLQPPARGRAAARHRGAAARPEVGQLHRRGPGHRLREHDASRGAGPRATRPRPRTRAGAGLDLDARPRGGSRCQRRGGGGRERAQHAQPPAAARPRWPYDAGRGGRRGHAHRTEGSGGPVGGGQPPTRPPSTTVPTSRPNMPLPPAAARAKALTPPGTASPPRPRPQRPAKPGPTRASAIPIGTRRPPSGHLRCSPSGSGARLRRRATTRTTTRTPQARNRGTASSPWWVRPGVARRA